MYVCVYMANNREDKSMVVMVIHVQKEREKEGEKNKTQIGKRGEANTDWFFFFVVFFSKGGSVETSQ